MVAVLPILFGPGTELKAILTALGFTIGGCKSECSKRADQMNAWGVEGCREHRETIIGWLKESADKLGWKEKLLALTAVATGAACFVPSIMDPIGSIVDESIRRAALNAKK
jgi:hypothetical protein